MEQTREQLEYAISQYLDGTLPPLELQVLEARLQRDESARALLEEYRRLDSVVKGTIAVPDISWDRLATTISAQVAECEAPGSAVRFRIGSLARVAIAATVVLAVGVVAALRFGRPAGSIAVSGPSAQLAGAPAVTEISIGPSPAIAASEASLHSSEVIISRPSTVIIASFDKSVQDSDEMPWGG